MLRLPKEKKTTGKAGMRNRSTDPQTTTRSSLHLPKRERGERFVAQRRSPEQEREIADRIGGRATLASGALSEKGDVRVKGVLRVEAKTTSNKSFSVTLDMLRKIEGAALPHGELPAMEIEFLNTKGTPIGSVAIVPVYVLELLGKWKKEQGL